MLNIRILIPFSGLIVVLFMSACADAPVETVEHRDDQGRTERFERRKKDAARHGLYQKIGSDGKIMEEAHYVNDTIDGEHKTFYPSGKVESVEHFKRGVYEGKYLKYYETGQLQLEQEYVNGALNGLSIKYFINGNVAEKVSLKNNDEDGPFTEYYENGQMKAEGTYATGDGEAKETGTLKEYDETGTLVRIAECKNGKCLTTWKKN
jgi:antitoxin component YwqK of YwqJK toxin-antitoxin module